MLGHIAHNYGTAACGVGNNQCAPTEAAAHQAVFAEIAGAPGLEQARPSAGDSRGRRLPDGIAGVLAPQPKGSRWTGVGK